MSAEQNVDLPAPAGPVMNTAYLMLGVVYCIYKQRRCREGRQRERHKSRWRWIYVTWLVNRPLRSIFRHWFPHTQRWFLKEAIARVIRASIPLMRWTASRRDNQNSPRNPHLRPGTNPSSTKKKNTGRDFGTGSRSQIDIATGLTFKQDKSHSKGWVNLPKGITAILITLPNSQQARSNTLCHIR